MHGPGISAFAVMGANEDKVGVNNCIYPSKNNIPGFEQRDSASLMGTSATRAE